MSKEMIIQLNKKLDELKRESRTLTDEMEKKYKEDPVTYVPGPYTEKMEKLQADADPIIAQITTLRKQLEMENFTEKGEGGAPNVLTPGTPAPEGGKVEYKTWGNMFIDSPEFKQAVELGLEKTKNVNVKAQYSGSGSVVTGTDSLYGGHLVVVDRLTTVYDKAPYRDRRILDLVGKSSTSSDRVEYAIIKTKTNNAGTVPERNAGGTDFGTKPQSQMTFDLATEVVRTIAHWIPASRQILMDAPQLRTLIDTYLSDGLELKVEDLILTGTGTNEWLGILNAAILSRVHAVSGARFSVNDNIIDSVRRAITDISVSFHKADGIAVHPYQAETLELIKDTTLNYLNVFNPLAQTVWRLPVIETLALPAGTALIGNFKQGCTLWDRMQTDIRVGEPNDYFIKNAVAVLAELRAAFGIIFTDMFEKVTGLP